MQEQPFTSSDWKLSTSHARRVHGTGTVPWSELQVWMGCRGWLTAARHEVLLPLGQVRECLRWVATFPAQKWQ